MRWDVEDPTTMLVVPAYRQKPGGVPDNPEDPAEWAKMPEAGTIYKVLHAKLSIKDASGRAVPPHRIPRLGSFLHAKDLGPGAEVERLKHLGAIREASEAELKKCLKENAIAFSEDEKDLRPKIGRESVPPSPSNPDRSLDVPRKGK